MGRRRRVAARVSRAPRFDTFTPSSPRASATARAIRRRDTKPEVMLRRVLRALGLTYLRSSSALPGHPDIVLAKPRVAVFVDGDFWHGRNWKERRAKLAVGSNASYWLAKITANMKRDRRKTRALRGIGWRVVRVWEGDVLENPASAGERVARAVKRPTKQRVQSPTKRSPRVASSSKGRPARRPK